MRERREHRQATGGGGKNIVHTLGASLMALVLSCCSASKAPITLSDDPPAGCVDGARNQQRYGTACLCCHQGEFSVAGSVDRTGPPVARVFVSDSDGHSVDMEPNAFDNFFRHYPLEPPLFPVVYAPDGRPLAMQAPAPSGDCNHCHGVGAVSRVHGPE